MLKLERRVTRDGMVSVGGNLYGVPDTTRRRAVEVHTLAHEVRVFEEGRLVAAHPVPEGHGRRRLDVGDYVRRGAGVVRGQLRHIASLFGGTEVLITEGFNANNHVMGGCIMGADPKDSVVDGDCRAHDHENLWLPGGAAIPSASVVNSTLTMAALGLKAADAVAARLGRG